MFSISALVVCLAAVGGDVQVAGRLQDSVANPTVAYLLLMLGFAGLLFEVSHPGAWLPGAFGLTCLFLAFLGLQALPVNYAGLALIVLGLVLLVLELKVHSLGLLTLAALVCLFFGSATLIEPGPGVERVSWLVIVPVTAATALVMLLLVGNVVRAHRAAVRTGMEGLLGSVGIVRGGDGGPAYVYVNGALWRARGDQPLHAGEKVRVLGYDGLTLYVQRLGEGAREVDVRIRA